MIPANAKMASTVTDQLMSQFPEYVELNALLTLAAKTWPRFGISAIDLSEYDPFLLEMLWIMLE